MKRKNIFKVIALLLISAVLVFTASCSSDGKTDEKSPAKARYDILGMDYQQYKKEYAVKTYKTTNRTVLNALFAKEAEGVTYFYGSDSVLVGVKDGKIVYYGYLTSAIFAATSFPTVKGLLEVEKLEALYGSAPEITEIQTDMPFASWKIENGFVGISSVGSSDLEKCYGNMASAFVACSDKALCSIYD